MIRTPDYRLRVFVSSTLGELAVERAAVKGAVEQLHLSPVLFELGARPHPPRELYRAYLEQSHVFVGIYWQRYGWVAPGEIISGLEDEYRLAENRPRLLYLKEPAPDREERLSALIDDFQLDDRASYKRFRTADELADLVREDLAILLTERFEAGATALSSGGVPVTAPPLPLTDTIGRADDVTLVSDLLIGGQRLVTLTGPGGVGKTRLALEVARNPRGSYPDGIHFVPLESVTDPDLVLRTLADQLSIRVEGNRSVRDAVADHLVDRQALLILDNLEQVVAAGPELSELLERCPELRVLATSRQALRVRGEHEVAVAPLPMPDPSAPLAVLAEQPAVRLFNDRARATVPGFTLDAGNVAPVAELCRRLDGLPLAIELAAARVRLLPPASLLARLGERLDLLAGGGPDRPERQRTLRATIDWSYELLEEQERAALARLSVFDGGWLLDAAEDVCGPISEADFLETLASLLDKSLVVTDNRREGEPRLRMLETVRAYARERLEERDETELLRRRHLDWYRRIADVAQPFLCGPAQQDWAARFDPERANLRAAVATALDLSDDEAVIEFVWDVIVYYFVRDAVDEPEAWMDSVITARRTLDEVHAAKLHSLRALVTIMRGHYDGTGAALESALAIFRAHGMDFEAAVVLKELANVHFVVDDDTDAAVADLEESIRLFDSMDHDWGVALTESQLGTVLCVTGALDPAELHHRRALDRSRRIANEPLIAQALQQIAMVLIIARRPEAAIPLIEEATGLLERARYETGATYCLDGVASVALARGDAATAARAVTVAEAVRVRLGIPVWPTVREFVDGLLDAARQALGPRRFDVLAAEAGDQDVFEALNAALASVGTNALSGALPSSTRQDVSR